MKIELHFPFDEAAIAIRRAVAPDAEWMSRDRYWLMTKDELIAFADAVAASADVGAEAKESVAISKVLAERVTFRLMDLFDRAQEVKGQVYQKALSVDPAGHETNLRVTSVKGTRSDIGGYDQAKKVIMDIGAVAGMTDEAAEIVAAVDAIIEQRHGTMIIISRDLRMLEEAATKMASDAGMRVIRSKADDRGAVRVIVAGRIERETLLAAFPTGANFQATFIRNAVL